VEVKLDGPDQAYDNVLVEVDEAVNVTLVVQPTLPDVAAATLGPTVFEPTVRVEVVLQPEVISVTETV
jgi:hypothetical protein